MVVRIALTATSIGSNDVLFETLWSNLIEKYGIAGAYARQTLLSRTELKIAIFPPLCLAFFQGMLWIARATHSAYSDVLRHFQSVADLVTTLSLVGIGRVRGWKNPYALALFFFLSPAAIFISAFHCNMDSTMVAFTTIAALLMVLPEQQEFASGLALAAATGIKILPLFLLPLFFLWSRRRARFVTGYSLAFFVIFLPAAWYGGSLVINNLLGYSGYAGKWGLPAVLLELEKLMGRPRQTPLYGVAYLYAIRGKFIVIAALLALYLSLWRRRAELLASVSPFLALIPLVYLIVLFLAPGFGVQYLLWPIPLLPFALDRRLAIWANAAISAYLFLTYTIWAEGFPWWYADSTAPVPHKEMVILLGIPLWLFLGYAGWRGLQNLWSGWKVESAAPASGA